jgi:hypothetical protein
MGKCKCLTRTCIGHFFRCANWHSLHSFYANLLHSKNANDVGVITKKEIGQVVSLKTITDFEISVSKKACGSNHYQASFEPELFR